MYEKTENTQLSLQMLQIAARELRKIQEGSP